ncbi:MAG: hypothetical protein Kow0092_16260 [Deferrisomatales bacterium]
MVRVLIERRISEGMVEAYNLALREMRLQAVQKAGYISGESLRDVTDPFHYVVISTWNAASDWNAWFQSEARRTVLAKIAPMLQEPERITVLEPV